jgi:hypothetical protein
VRISGEQLALPDPCDGERLEQPWQREAVRCAAVEDRLELLGSGYLADGRIATLVEHALVPERARASAFTSAGSARVDTVAPPSAAIGVTTVFRPGAAGWRATLEP